MAPSQLTVTDTAALHAPRHDFQTFQCSTDVAVLEAPTAAVIIEHNRLHVPYLNQLTQQSRRLTAYLNAATMDSTTRDVAKSRILNDTYFAILRGDMGFPAASRN